MSACRRDDAAAPTSSSVLLGEQTDNQNEEDAKIFSVKDPNYLIFYEFNHQKMLLQNLCKNADCRLMSGGKLRPHQTELNRMKL